tara:strand:- start:1822 stop:2286 length:465 start_codon:yes stop_codon:yes gene_type:complete
MHPILESSKTYVLIQKEINKILKTLNDKELPLSETRKIVSYLENKSYDLKNIKPLIKLARKHKVQTKSLEKHYKSYKNKEKDIKDFKKQLKKLGLKNIEFHPKNIHARGKENSYIYIHLTKPPIVNFFPIGDVHNDLFNDYIEDLEKQIKNLLK